MDVKVNFMSVVRLLLKQYSIQPRKKLGQSFLDDRDIVRQIVSMADPCDDETIVEIGAGLGIMTQELAKKARRVIALEFDPHLVDVLKVRLKDHKCIEVIEIDVLKYDFASACREGKVKVVGNIPYNISSQILFHLLRFRRSISSMILMFQKELADRICAGPGTREYGIPSVLVSRYCITSQILTVPPACFYPVPEVVSSLLSLSVRQNAHLFNDDVFVKIVRTAFAHKRKTLWNNLRHLGDTEELVERILDAAGIDRDRRAESLTVDEFSRIANMWIGQVPGRFPDDIPR